MCCTKKPKCNGRTQRQWGAEPTVGGRGRVSTDGFRFAKCFRLRRILPENECT